MADSDPTPESDDGTKAPDTEAMRKLHDLAMQRFDSVAMPQLEDRELRLRDRRFVDVEGAQWEGPWGEQWENSPRPELDKITKNGEKIEGDYRENRITVGFIPTDGEHQDTANTLNDMFRADVHTFKSSQAFDNAFSDGWKGGMGAWRMSTDYADPYDPDNDHQRINPGIIIPDADQCVFFDGASVMYDASDAKWAVIVSALQRADAVDQFGEDIPDFDTVRLSWQYEWFTPDIVRVAEYYEVEQVPDDVLIFTQKDTQEEQRFFKSEMEDGQSADLKAQGWTVRTKKWKRRRVHKYLLCGSCVLRDYGYIAGDQIPIVPFYARFSWIDGVPRVRGYVRKKIDAQRTLNAVAATLTEIDSLAPFEVPMVTPGQIAGHEKAWAEANITRAPYRLLNPLLDDEGKIVATGPIGMVQPPQVPPVAAARLQFALQILSDDDDGASQIRSNVSGDAMEMAADRVDAVSRIFLDNFKMTMQRCGEIYRGMAREIYFEKGRKVPTRTMDGQQGTAELQEPVVDPVSGAYHIRNDLTRGNFTVEASVEEATSTKMQKASRQAMELGNAFMTAQSPQDALAAFYTAAENISGYGIDDLIDFYRQRSIALGATKPTKEEEAQIKQAEEAKQGQPDPQAIALQAATQEAASKAALNQASAADKQASAQLKTVQAETLAKAPEVPTGLSSEPTNPIDAADKLAGARLKNAQAEHLSQDMEHRRIKTGHDLEMERRQQDLAERQQDHAEAQPRGE
jgi:hypothetical protein